MRGDISENLELSRIILRPRRKKIEAATPPVSLVKKTGI